MTPHLGDLVAALVDNELDHDARDYALAHLAHCAECRGEVEQQRGVKNLLAAQSGPGVPRELTARLHALPATDLAPATARRRRIWGSSSHRARPRVRMLAGALSIASIGFGVALALGGDRDAPGVRPPIATFVQEHGATTGDLPLGDPAANILLTSFPR